MKKKTNFTNTNAQVAVIKALHRLRMDDLAEVANINKVSVARWFLDPKNKNYRKAPYEVAHKLGKKYSMVFEEIT